MASVRSGTRHSGDSRRLIDRIVRRHFGQAPRCVESLEGGLMNDVFRFEVKGSGHVLRLHSEPEQLAAYRQEQWAVQQARKVRVPVAGVREVGLEGKRPYMIADEVRGIPGTHWTDAAGVMRELGRLAARLHQIRTRGFGREFAGAVPGQRSFQLWSQFLDNDLHASDRLLLLDRQQVLTDAARAEVHATLDVMRRWRRAPVLQHGDLRLKNVIVSPDDGRILALLDWDNCMSAPPPFWDLSIALHDVGPDEKEAFLDGYGMSAAQFERLAPVLRALNLLNYAWALQQARRAGERGRAAWLRARLRGAFDIAA
jgi:aminoglycoside phosphotransferase (APT) family kinase protein